ncbi:hypothetical protein CBI38_33625 (plasmid) [Rhodococcus oxybenzonivorans]|uniref:Uncharacterized protein n=1 Tax=Rhodococcus oxybenzonivorans TaxID=1990687 RepID=A0A2S2C6D8_9NOCA|nr:hypothetical protein [Rhodococcus oxybenzonivorans]AWK76374.1 hypothetical protein CBI38_33625 [Rhodococcus oxybenzonivorans]
MTETSPPRTVADARELLELTELTDIVFFETGARRKPDVEETPLSIQIALRREELLLEVRCRATVSGSGGEYLADASAVFTLREPIEAADAIITEFVERVGVMSVYPYLRESITQSGAKLGLDRPVLKLLRPGDIHITVDDSDDKDSTEAT